MPPFSSQLERCLDSFDGVSEWADIISFLSRLSRVLNDQDAFRDGIPHKWLLGKRLGQCLNVSLPTGVHSKALEVYLIILSKLQRHQIAEYLPNVFMGLFSYADGCPALMKRLVLSIFEDYILCVTGETSPHIDVVVLALLSFLDDKSSEFFDIAYKRLAELSDRLTDASFYSVLIRLLITCGSRRQQVYLMMERISFTSVQQNIDVKMLSRALLASLSDNSLANIRDSLAFLSQNLKLDSCYIEEPTWTAIIIQAFLTLRYRDSSVIRRLNQWWGVESPESSLSPRGLQILVTSLQSAIQTLPDEYLHHLSFILTALLDNKALAKFIIPAIAVDLVIRIYRSPRSNEIAGFFDVVELQYIWDPIIETIFLKKRVELIEALNFNIQLYPLVDDSLDVEIVSNLLSLTCEPSQSELLEDHDATLKLLDIINQFQKIDLSISSEKFYKTSEKLLKYTAVFLAKNTVFSDVKFHYTSKFITELQCACDSSLTFHFESLSALGAIYLPIFQTFKPFNVKNIVLLCKIIKLTHKVDHETSYGDILSFVWRNCLAHISTSPCDILLIFSELYKTLGSIFLEFITNQFMETDNSKFVSDILLNCVKDDELPGALIFYLLHHSSHEPKSNDKFLAIEKNPLLIPGILETCHHALIMKNHSFAVYCLNSFLGTDLNLWQHSACANAARSLQNLLNINDDFGHDICLGDIVTLTVFYLLFYYESSEEENCSLKRFSLSWPRNVESLLPNLQFKFVAMFTMNLKRGYTSLHLEIFRLAITNSFAVLNLEDSISLLTSMLDRHLENIFEPMSVLSDILLMSLSSDESFHKFSEFVCLQISNYLALPVMLNYCRKLDALSFLVSKLCTATVVNSKSISSLLVLTIQTVLEDVLNTSFLGPDAEEYQIRAAFLNTIIASHSTIFLENLPTVIGFDFNYVDIRVFSILKLVDLSKISFDGFLPNKPSKYDRSKIILNRFSSVAILSQIDGHKPALESVMKVMRLWALEIFSGSKSKQFMLLFFRWIVFRVLSNDGYNMQDVLISYIESYCQNIIRAVDKSQIEDYKDPYVHKEIFAAVDLNEVFAFIQDSLLFYLDDIFTLNSDYEIACGYILSMLISPMWRSKSILWTKIGISLFSWFPKKRTSKLWKKEFWEYFVSIYSPERSEPEINKIVCECLEIYLSDDGFKIDDIFSRSGSISLSIFTSKENETNFRRDLLGRIGLVMFYCSPERLFDQIPPIIGKFQEILKDDAVRGEVYKVIGILCSRVQMHVLNPFMPSLIMHSVPAKNNIDRI